MSVPATINDPLWCIGKPLTKPKPELWRFCSTTFNGRTYPSVEHHDLGGSKEPLLGTQQRFDLADHQHDLSLGELAKLFIKQDTPGDTRRSWERDPALKAKMIDRLAKTIIQSTEKGERDNARALYRRLAGMEFNG